MQSKPINLQEKLREKGVLWRNNVKVQMLTFVFGWRNCYHMLHSLDHHIHPRTHHRIPKGKTEHHSLED